MLESVPVSGQTNKFLIKNHSYFSNIKVLLESKPLSEDFLRISQLHNI